MYRCPVGSDLDRKIKQASAGGESAWNGIGQKPELRVWRIEKFQVKPWPKDHYGTFHKGDSYIVLNSYRKGNSEALCHDIHMWIGDESSQDEYGTAGTFKRNSRTSPLLTRLFLIRKWNQKPTKW